MKRECYVYLALPGETGFVTAGKFEQTVDQDRIPVGRFIYAQSYLERPNAVAIDPIELKLTRQVFETRRLDGIFGALRDASPDYWGVDRYFPAILPITRFPMRGLAVTYTRAYFKRYR